MSADGVQKIIEEIDKSSSAQVSEILAESKKKADEAFNLVYSNWEESKPSA